MEKSIYILYGTNIELMNEFILDLKNKLNIDDNSYFDFSDDYTINQVINELNNYSLFESKKIIKYKTNDLISFKNYFKNPNPDIILILLTDKLNLKEEYDYIEAIEFKELNDKELAKYIKKQLNNADIEISNDALDEFVIRIKTDFNQAKMEVDKIITYCDKKIKTVDLKMILNLVPSNLDDNIFLIIESIIERNKKRALKIYNDLIKSNQDVMQILNVLQNKFNEIFYIKVLLDENKTKEEISKYFNYSKGRTYYAIKTASNFDISSIRYFIKELSDLEYKIKSGIVDSKIAIELFILELR